MTGSRFNNADRGAWYAAFQLSTAQAEVAFHKTVHLAEVGRYEDEVEFDDYLADFHCEFHDLRRTRRFVACLDPASYVASQTLAETLLENGSTGLIYPSVRRRRGTCLACFDPQRVANVRRAGRLRFSWRGKPVPQIVRVVHRREGPLAHQETGSAGSEHVGARRSSKRTSSVMPRSTGKLRAG